MLLLLGWWLRRRMMSFVLLQFFRSPVVLVLRFQPRRLHFDFVWSLPLALVSLRLEVSASRPGSLQQALVLLSVPSL